MKKEKYELRRLDCWLDCDGGYILNDSMVYDTITIKDGANIKRAFLRALHKNDIVCNRGKCKIEIDIDGVFLVERKTGEPLFALVLIDY